MNFALNYKGTTTNTKGICVMSMDKCYQFSLLDGIDREFEQDKKSVNAYLSNHPKLEKRKASFQMVIDDVYAISKGRLVGKPK